MSGGGLGRDPGGREGGRARILRRIRDAVGGREPAAHPGPLPVGAGPALSRPGDLSGSFADALGRGGGETVLLPDLASARRWLADLAAGFSTAAVGEGVPPELSPDLPPADPRDAALGVSRAWAGAATTGSLVLHSGEGRRVQLLPPVHLVWIDRGALYPGLDEALAAARGEGGLPSALALHSGPSKSADIGRIVVTGVHGPGRVIAAVLGAGGGEGPSG